MKQRALCAGHGLDETVARFLRCGMDHAATPAIESAMELLLARRREMTHIFVAGQCGATLDNFEADRETDYHPADAGRSPNSLITGSLSSPLIPD